MVGGYSLISSNYQVKGIHLLFIHFLDTMPLHFTTPKLIEYGKIAQEVSNYPHGESHLMYADVGTKPIE
jgi:hypothetical protein